jgi:hypothetical protein
MFEYGRNDARRPFTLDKGPLRKQARSKGICTRCVVRPARQGKAYCQRCTDYVKRYARKRNQRLDAYASGYGRYSDKVMRVADYGSDSRYNEQPPGLGADTWERATTSEHESQARKEFDQELARLTASRPYPMREPRWYRPGAKYTDEGD